MNSLHSHERVARISVMVNMLREKIRGCRKCKGGKEIAELGERSAIETAKLIDEGFLMETNQPRIISTNSIFWAMIDGYLTTAFILIVMIVFLVNMRRDILDLESKVFPTGRMFTEESE